MLTVKENDRLTRVGPNTPIGELMRRYWIPVRQMAFFGVVLVFLWCSNQCLNIFLLNICLHPVGRVQFQTIMIGLYKLFLPMQTLLLVIPFTFVMHSLF